MDGVIPIPAGGICRIFLQSVAAVIEDAEEMSGFVSDGVDDRFVGAGGVEHHERVVALVRVAGIDGFRQSGETAV